MTKRTNILACILSGVLLLSVFPKFSLHYLAWISLIPLLWCIKRNHTTTSSCFFLGWLTGVIFFVGLLYWLINTITHFGNIHILLSIPIFLLLCLYLGSYIGIFAALVQHLRKYKIPICISAPVIWTSFEFIRGHLLSGFPWGSLGYSQSCHLSMIQSADIIGVYGLSFIILLVNCCIFEIGDIYLIPNNDGRTRKTLSYALIIVLLLGGLFIYGNYRIKETLSINSHEQKITIGLIQPNIRQEDKLKISTAYTILEILKGLSIEACSDNDVDIIVWPETAYTSYFYPLHDPIYSAISKIAKEIPIHLLTGAAQIKYTKNGIMAYNSAIYFNSEGELLTIYNKMHLVPFGEYFPLPFIKKILHFASDISPGSQFTQFNIHDHSFGVVICFEAIFPSLCRQFVLNGTQFLINITNDAWFGNTAAPYQHFQMILFRAIENRTWLMRAANTGISAIISPIGKVMTQSGIFTQEIVKGHCAVSDIRSFYTLHGDIFSVLCLMTAIILLCMPPVFLK
ncbi:MAG: apolipoprotein N-acyltransferase [bacterium]